MLNKILADKYKNKVNDKKIDEQIEKCKSNTAVKINLKGPSTARFNSR